MTIIRLHEALFSRGKKIRDDDTIVPLSNCPTFILHSRVKGEKVELEEISYFHRKRRPVKS